MLSCQAENKNPHTSLELLCYYNHVAELTSCDVIGHVFEFRLSGVESHRPDRRPHLPRCDLAIFVIVKEEECFLQLYNEHTLHC